MSNAISTIPVLKPRLMAVPVAMVTVIYYRWMMRYQTILHACARMVTQLILIGYALNHLFAHDNAPTMTLVFVVMLLLAGWIALYPLKRRGIVYAGNCWYRSRWAASRRCCLSPSSLPSWNRGMS